MENVFDFRNNLINEYSSFSRSFSKIAANDIAEKIESEYRDGRYWPEALIQINPNYERKNTVQELAVSHNLHKLCADIFQVGKTEGKPQPLHLYAHQLQALAKAQTNHSYVVTTGTGSGKSLSFFIPIIDRILKEKEKDSKKRTRAIVIYPMNALANSQLEELDKFLFGYSQDKKPFTVARYTGQESADERKLIADNPPDILLTNFMMLELILTRYEEVDRSVVDHCLGLNFLVLDELHTYRGRQGADVALLVRRLRERLQSEQMICIGTSATMSSTGTLSDRNKTVAEVSTKLFGTSITPDDVIGETLERVTDKSKDIEAVKPFLKERVLVSSFEWSNYDQFTKDPLAIWVELVLGIELPLDEPPRRAKPITLKDASTKLAEHAGCSFDEAKSGLQKFLIAAHEVRTSQNRPPFAFKLHQFISGPGKVLSTLETENVRYVTLDAQRFAPGRQEENVRLYPVHFCRDCGQEYFPVWHSEKTDTEFNPREIDDISSDEDQESRYGFLCPSNDTLNYKGGLEDLPELWIDWSKAEPKIKSTYKKAIPQEFSIGADGVIGHGESYWFIPGKFRFCLSCGQSHEAHGKDINRLASLSGEGRSSATTILTLSAIRQLFETIEIPEGQSDPRKILGFTDNRQDAALQAGHFNDFIFLLMLRSALIGALQDNGGSLSEENLADAVFKALGFDQITFSILSEYLRNPKLMGLARSEAQRTMRFIIGYRLVRDLRRGWRYNNPNLDQLNLLKVNYQGLTEFSNEKSLFEGKVILSQLSADHIQELSKIVFNNMRRGLCLESRYLDSAEQEKAKNSSFQYINDRWSFSVDEKLEESNFLTLNKLPEDKAYLVSGGPRSRLMKEIKSASFWSDSLVAIDIKSMKDTSWIELVEDLLKAASLYGYVQSQEVQTGVIGWKLKAASLEWKLLTEDDIDEDAKHNLFFRTLYLAVADTLRLPNHPIFDFEAQEHTAQVDANRRQLLEQRFRYTEKDRKDWDENPAHQSPLERLPVMFCSPTMELGVDISALNTVYLRNVPPTPANYAQRSGRAGRSGQQALVITYCAALSPHDQWFFNNATEMVHGIVKPPTLDLANRDLVESHLHALWLSSVQVQLDTSIGNLLNLDDANKPLKVELEEQLTDPSVNERAQLSADKFISQLSFELKDSSWFSETHVKEVINRSPQQFSASFDRWRSLVDSTLKQMNMADELAKSHTSSHQEKTNAQRRYIDASKQYAVLLKSGNGQNSDFYTYRYLASQGFLPGYNFPRLPLMAWIPARGSSKDDEGSMVSRPRFLALSEFGPRSLIYHQGRMYRVVRAKLNIGSSEHISGTSSLSTISSRVCCNCGYAHMGEPGGAEPIAERCENCDTLLTDQDWVKNLYKIETVETVQVERISINDEDRQRQGFELQTTYKFLPGPDKKINRQKGIIKLDEEPFAELTYSASARLWRINRGWRRRKDKNQLGFYINPITGTWSKKDEPGAIDSPEAEDSLAHKVPNQQIVPFVEDHRNILILQPTEELDLITMATLQAALKRGIEMTFQIEESELVAEPLPNIENRRSLMFYEAAEGGAGVLTRLATDPKAMSMVASAALKLIHYEAPKGTWKYEDLLSLEKKNKYGNSICEAGCYQCLLSYFNQPDHDNIDRRNEKAQQLLVALANANIEMIPSTEISELCEGSEIKSDKTKLWIEALKEHSCKEPDAINISILEGQAIATGQYKDSRTFVFLDPVPQDIKVKIIDKGWQVLEMTEPELWKELFEQYYQIFKSINGS